MERENHLSENLSAIRNALYPKPLSEIASEIHISKSTLQDAIATGNVNLDTAIRIANALHLSLDALVFGTIETRQVDFLHHQLLYIFLVRPFVSGQARTVPKPSL